MMSSDNREKSNHVKRTVVLAIGIVALIGLLVFFFTQMANQPKHTPAFKVGDYVQFGSYNKQPIQWRVIHLESDGTPLLFSDRILSIKAFDKEGTYHQEERRQESGSNNYESSNLRQWLNSDEGKIIWKQNMPMSLGSVKPDNEYHEEKGFLAFGNFTKKERSWMKSRTHNVLLAELDKSQASGGSSVYKWQADLRNFVPIGEQAYYKTLTDRVFLLSLNDLKQYVYDQRATFGDDWWLGKPTAAAVQKSSFQFVDLNQNSPWYYWLNSPDAASSYGVAIVDYEKVQEGGLNTTEANKFGIGVRPATMLDLSAALFTEDGKGTAAKPYVVDGR